MYKKFVTISSIVCVIFLGCSKKNQPGPQGSDTSHPIRIEVVSGDKQTDTIGRLLANPVVIKVTVSGGAAADYQVQIIGSGCNNDRVDKYRPAADGTIKYDWSLAGDVGAQTLKIFVIDSKNQKVDSVTATSTGLEPSSGWHKSACITGFDRARIFCKLSTGRLFATFESLSLRYSDDNGRSWNYVKSLGLHKIEYVISTPHDEIFAFTVDEATYHSIDGGNTWEALPVPPFKLNEITFATYTPKGRLIVNTKQHPIYISVDGGKTWSSPGPFTIPTYTGVGGEFYSAAEDQAGNLYTVAQGETMLFESIDAGKTWTFLPGDGLEQVLAIYVANNGWIYKSRFDPAGGIYISKDGGATYSLWYNFPSHFIKNLSVQSDGNFYFSVFQEGVYQTNGLSGSVKRIFDNNGSVGFAPYVVANNGNIIAADTGNGITRFYQK